MACGRGYPIKIRKDLFGISDILAAHPEEKLLALIQVTSGSNLADRRNKIALSPLIAPLLNSGFLVECHGWRKGGARGARKLWKLTRHQARIHGDGIQWLDVTENEEETCDLFA